MEPPNEPKPLSSSKGEDENHHQKQRNSELLLDLSLGTNDSDQGFDLEGDHIKRFNVENPHNPEAEPRVFSCNYCQRKFYSSQALGGHQNAHKRERTLAKRGQRFASTAFGNYYPDHFYKAIQFSPSISSSSSSSSSYPSNIAALPLYGSYNSNNHNNKHNNRNNINHRHLGIQAHSLIHKPSSSSSLSSPYLAFSSNGSSSHHGWSRMPMFNQQRPGIGRLGMMVSLSPSSSSSNGGAAKFGSVVVQKNSQPLDRTHRSSVGGVCWKGSTNVLGTKQLPDHDQLHKLDLSLKL